MIMTALALAGAIVLAIGLFGLFLSFNTRKGGREFLVMVVASIAFIIIGGYLVFGFLSIDMIIRKFAGILLVFSGVFLVVKFPGGYIQNEKFTVTAVLIGLILLIFGIYLTLF